MIYLDYSAGTPADPAVLERFCQAEQRWPGNPNSAHAAGRAARDELARVTQSIAALLGVAPAEVLYTSGASEANNLAVKGVARANGRTAGHILITPLEHPSVSAAAAALQKQGFAVEQLALLPDGTVDLARLRQSLRPHTVLVTVPAVDSELGVIQPVQAIARAVQERPACRLHVDATQAVGKTDVWFAGLGDGVDTISFSPHKFYGLNGSGVLLHRRGLELEPLIHGGAGTTRYRNGTPALALAAAAETALRTALEQQPARTQQVRRLNSWLRQELLARPGVRINSPAGAVPHILNVSVQGIKGTAFQRALDAEGVCVSVRSACASDGAPSQAVLAVSGDARNALAAWRISLSHRTTLEELEQFLAAFDRCRARLAQS